MASPIDLDYHECGDPNCYREATVKVTRICTIDKKMYNVVALRCRRHEHVPLTDIEKEYTKLPHKRG